jgi:sec-independent protein translocase protein TatA
MKLGGMEWVVILLIVVIIFGPTQIPKLTKMLGKSVKGFKDGMDDSKDVPETKEKTDEKE